MDGKITQEYTFFWSMFLDILTFFTVYYKHHPVFQAGYGVPAVLSACIVVKPHVTGTGMSLESFASRCFAY